MFSNTIFYTLPMITTLCIASELPENRWLTLHTHEIGGKLRDGTTLMMIKCVCANNLPEDFSPTLDFEQDEHGSLFAVYQKQKQLLGSWPHLTMNTQATIAAWYYGANPTVEIQIPYRYRVRKNAPTS